MALSLSLSAVDILFEDLKLGRVPQPFEVPSAGETLTQRAQVREAVYRTLTQRDVMRNGRLDADVEHGLVTFAKAPFAIAAVGQLDDGPLFARVCSDGHFALLVEQRENTLVFTDIWPTALIPVIVDLLPLTRAAHGTSVTVEVPAPGDGAYNPFEGVRGQKAVQRRAADRIFAQPIQRVGAFLSSVVTPGVSGERAKQSVVSQVSWFDTEEGRHFATQTIAEDGGQQITYTPGDNARIAGYLHQVLAEYLP